MANKPVPVSGDTKQLDQDAKKLNALWYTFHGVGRAYLVQRGSYEAGIADTYSVHGYSTIEEAYTNANTDDAATQAVLTSWDAAASLPAGGGELGLMETVNITAPTKKGQEPAASTQQNPATSFAKQNVPNPLSGLAAIAAALAKFVGYLGDVAMWRSLGWLLLGVIMVIAGILLWLKKENYLPSAVPVPV